MSLNAQGSLAVDRGAASKDQSRVMFVLGTAISERVMRPMFGASIANAIGLTSSGIRKIDDIAGNAVQEVVTRAVTDAFDSHLPHLSLVDLIFRTEFAETVYFVDVVWAYPSNVERTYTGRVDVSGFVDTIGRS